MFILLCLQILIWSIACMCTSTHGFETIIINHFSLLTHWILKINLSLACNDGWWEKNCGEWAQVWSHSPSKYINYSDRGIKKNCLRFLQYWQEPIKGILLKSIWLLPSPPSLSLSLSFSLSLSLSFSVWGLSKLNMKKRVVSLMANCWINRQKKRYLNKFSDSVFTAVLSLEIDR